MGVKKQKQKKAARASLKVQGAVAEAAAVAGGNRSPLPCLSSGFLTVFFRCKSNRTNGYRNGTGIVSVGETRR